MLPRKESYQEAQDVQEKSYQETEMTWKICYELLRKQHQKNIKLTVIENLIFTQNYKITE